MAQDIARVETIAGTPGNIFSHDARTTFHLANGNVIMLTHDGGSNLFVYEIPANHVSRTLRATIAQPADATFHSGGVDAQVSAALWADGSLSIVVKSRDKRLVKFCKVTTGTWAVSAWETGFTQTAPFVIENFDITMTDTNVLLMSCIIHNGSTDMSAHVYARLANGTWTHPWGGAVVGPYHRLCSSTSITALNVSSSQRNVVAAFGMGKTGTDYGVAVNTMKVHETTGVGTVVTGRQTLLVGESPTGSWIENGTLGRVVKLFRTNTNEYLIAIAHGQLNKKWGVGRGFWDGTTWTETKTFKGVNGSLNSTPYGCGISVILGSDPNNCSVNFAYPLVNSSSTGYYIANNIYTWEGTSFSLTGPYNYTETEAGYGSGYTRPYLASSGQRNLTVSKHDIAAFSWTGTTRRTINYWAAVPDPVGSAIKELFPADGSAPDSSNPSLTAKVDTDKSKGQARYRIQFQFATNSGFSVNLIDYLQPRSKLQKVDGTDQANVRVTFSDVLPAPHSLTAVAWYYRARLADEFGNVGSWSAVNQLAVAHPGTFIPLSPNSAQEWPETSGTFVLRWDFVDPAPGDYQTAVELELFADGVSQGATGKFAFTDHQSNWGVDTGTDFLKDKTLSWRGRAWDSQDTPSPWSAEMFFLLTDLPTIVVNNPSVAEELNSGVPTFSVTVDTGGTRTISNVTFVVLKAGNPVWSVVKPGPIAQGATVEHKIPTGYLENHSDYSFQAQLVDSAGIVVSSSLIPFSVEWVPPPGPDDVVLSTVHYNIEDEGYISISWSNGQESVDFAGYIVYRKDDLIMPNTTNVITEGDWVPVHAEYESASGYEFRDYFAPSNYKVNYKVTQLVNVDGQLIESEAVDVYESYPSSDGYWLIEPTSDNTSADAFKLSIVTGDSYTDEQEEVEYVVIGRGRMVEKGEKLGIKGTLDAQLRHSPTISAREKKLRLERIKEVEGILWMRTPFGDSYPVNVSAMSVSRIAGVGASEFVDVSIPYTEVAR